MESKLKSFILLALSALLAVFGFGANCPGTGSKTEFVNPTIQTLIATPQSSKSWRAPIRFIDMMEVDTSTIGMQNVTGPFYDAVLYSYPMAILSHTATKFVALQNRSSKSVLAGSNTYGYAVEKTDVTAGSAWVSTLADFTRMDINTSDDSVRPLLVADSVKNTYAFYSSYESNWNRRRVLAIRKGYGNPNWDAPVKVSDDVNVAGNIFLHATQVAVDASDEPVVVWGQNSRAYFNQYRPFLGWRFTPGSTFMSWCKAADAGSVLDYGMDIGFDSYGNGYGVYVADAGGATQKIVASRWRGGTLQNFYPATAADHTTLATGALVFGYPRIYVAPNGAATVFYYYNNAGNNAELWSASTPANSSAAPGIFTAASRFDSSYGTGDVLMKESSDYLGPILSYSGSQAVMGFVKSDGVSNRLFVFRYSGGSWVSIGNADLGGSGNDVNWASLAINSSGDVAAVWSVSSVATEHVYGNVYTNSLSSWTGVTQLSNSASLTAGISGTATGKTRPSVAIDSSGNAVATFSMDGAGAYAGKRRAVVVSFY